MLARLMSLVDRFVPDEHLEDFQTHMRSRLIVMMFLIVIGSLPLMMFQHIVRGETLTTLVSIVVMGLFSGSTIAHRTHPDLIRSARVLLIGGWLGVLVTTLLSGGLYSSVTPFFAILPIMALALLGSGAAVVWFIVSTISLVFLATLAEFDVFFGDPLTFLEPLPWISNLLLMMLYALGLIWFDEEMRRVQNEELQAALLRVDAASAAKSTFMANMSHELRTPMNGVLGMTELLLRDDALSTQSREQLLAIEESGRALVNLLNDILDLSKIEAGKVVVEHITWEPEALLNNVRRLFEGSAHAKGLQLRMIVDPDLPHRLKGDPMKIRQVLTNLVGNAVKFTSSGTVTIEASRRVSSLILAVEDTGRGISDEKRALIFEPFTQEDASTARRHGGSGLGLAICMHLAQWMKGSLALTSTGKDGSRFELSLPLEISDETPAPLPRSDASPRQLTLEGTRVLLVEDIAINRMVAQGMLRSLGCMVDAVENGLAARELLTSDQSWDVVLMDWHLPGLDGVELTREVRQKGYRGAIVAVSASVRDEDRQIMQAAGMNAFLGKPFTQDGLATAMRTALQQKPTG